MLLNKIKCLCFVLLCLNLTCASRIDILKEFPGQNVSDIEFKSFRIPLSLILTSIPEARLQNNNKEPLLKPTTKKIANHFTTAKPTQKLVSKGKLAKNTTIKDNTLTTIIPPIKLSTREPPITFVVPIQVEVENENELAETMTTVEPVESIGVEPGEIEEEQVTEVPQQDVVGQAVRFPCQCVEGQCGCCTGVFLQRLRMKACGNISFVPEEFVFDMKFSFNNNTVVRRRVSASDPPPVCFNPRRAPFVEVCAELSNIHVKDRNAYACLDVDANVGGFPVYSTSFKCFSLGSSGIKTGLKPKPIKKPTGAPAATNLFGNNDNDDNEDEGLLGGDGLLGDGGGIFGGGESEGGGLFGGGSNDGDGDEGGGIFGGGDNDGDGIFGGGDEGGLFGGGDEGGLFGGGGDGGFDGPDFDGAFEGAGELLEA